MLFGRNKRKQRPASPLPPSGSPVVGLYGKHPSAGDFLRHNAGGPEIRELDQWLGNAVDAGKRLLPRWSESYPSLFTASFLLDFDAASRALMGVMVPSQDAGGREFPLVVFATVDRGPARDHFCALAHEPFFAAATRLLQRRNTMTRDDLLRGVDTLRGPGRESLAGARQAHEAYLAQTSWNAAFTAMFGISALMQRGNALGTMVGVARSLSPGGRMPRYGIRAPLGHAQPGNAGLWLELLGPVPRSEGPPSLLWSLTHLVTYLRVPSAKALPALLDPTWQDETICDLATAQTGEDKVRFPDGDGPLSALLNLAGDRAP